RVEPTESPSHCMCTRLHERPGVETPAFKPSESRVATDPGNVASPFRFVPYGPRPRAALPLRAASPVRLAAESTPRLCWSCPGGLSNGEPSSGVCRLGPHSGMLNAHARRIGAPSGPKPQAPRRRMLLPTAFEFSRTDLTMKRHGFTLVELLVVIAIIAI